MRSLRRSQTYTSSLGRRECRGARQAETAGSGALGVVVGPCRHRRVCCRRRPSIALIFMVSMSATTTRRLCAISVGDETPHWSSDRSLALVATPPHFDTSALSAAALRPNELQELAVRSENFSACPSRLLLAAEPVVPLWDRPHDPVVVLRPVAVALTGAAPAGGRRLPASIEPSRTGGALAQQAPASSRARRFRPVRASRADESLQMWSRGDRLRFAPISHPQVLSRSGIWCSSGTVAVRFRTGGTVTGIALAVSIS